MIQNCSRILLYIVLSLSALTGLAEAQQTEAKAKVEAEATDIGSAPDQKALDNLKKYLVGSKWKGTFTVRGKDDKLHTEEYEISGAEKEPKGDQWVLTASIKYLKKETRVPVPIYIKWIDRTPVMVMDQVTLPGMGTFDARVIIRKGMYAGTWAHDEVGGHLFGEITTAAAAAEKAKMEEMKK